MKLNLISLLLSSFCLYIISYVGGEGKKESTDEIVSDSLKIDTSTNDHKIETTIVYDSVKVGKQVWMQRNLDVVTFRNGDSIFNAQTNEEWIQAIKDKKPAWCYYNNDKELGEKYGILYNWYTVNDCRELAPKGWRIPSRKDFKELEVEVKGFYQRIGNDKRKGEWISKLKVNQRGFKALRAGGRFQEGEFRYLEEAVYFWSITKKENLYDNNNAYMLMFTPVFSMIADYPQQYGLTIRCIKNSNAPDG